MYTPRFLRAQGSGLTTVWQLSHLQRCGAQVGVVAYVRPATETNPHRTIETEHRSWQWLRRFSTQVRAVGVFCPATDFLDWDGKKYGLDLMQGQLVFRDGIAGKPEQQIEDAAKLISPVYQVRPGLPPFLLIHGDVDSLIPIQQSKKFADTVRKANGSAELIVKKGGDHSWPTVREEIEKLADWLDARLSVHGVE